MADQIQALLVSLEARIAGYEREMKRAVGVSSRSAKQIESRFSAMNGAVERSFGKVAAVYGSIQFLRGATALIDANTRVQNSLKVAGLEGEALTNVYDQLFASAQRNAAPLESLVTLYGRAAIVQKELGVSTEELLGFTDNVAVALRVAGTDASTASGALLQLSQALGAGTVRAEEFNSILEGALPVAQAAAAGLEEAGGSVAKLRALVVDGKVSSEAFFRAFEAGAYILTDKVAGAELTVSQAFVRLQNVLQDVAGKFNEGTGAGRDFSTFLADLGDKITIAGDNFDQGITPIQRFLDFVQDVSREAGKAVGADNIGAGIKEGLEGAHSSIELTEVLLTEAEQALVNFAANGQGRFGDLQPVVDDFIQQLLEGKGNAEKATEAINAMGAPTDFGGLLGSLGGLVSSLFAVRDAAVAAREAASFSDVGDLPSWGDFQSQFGTKPAETPKPQITLEDPRYRITGSGGKKGGGGKGDSGQSPGEKLSDILAKQAEENRLLAEKTALQATLNPLVNDYGFAVDKLRVAQELQSAATAAGIEMTPALKAQIDKLATGYANASVEAAKLAEAQDNAKQLADDFGNTGRSALSGFISDLRAGKSAADALSSAMDSILDSVIQIGLNAILGGLGGGGFGGIGKLFGFAEGGIAAHGKPKMFANGGISKTAAIFGEAGPEAAVPLPDGRRIPVDLRMPTPKAANDNGALRVQIELDNDMLNAKVVNTAGRVVASAAPTIVQSAVDRAPAAMAEKQARFG